MELLPWTTCSLSQNEKNRWSIAKMRWVYGPVDSIPCNSEIFLESIEPAH